MINATDARLDDPISAIDLLIATANNGTGRLRHYW